MMIKIFADGANLGQIRELADDPQIAGFTTNPSLARKAGVTRYRAFAEQALRAARGKPVSIEVLSDDFAEMGRQARGIVALGKNAFVKIPVTDSTGKSSAALITELAADGIPLNVTAVFTPEQVKKVGVALSGVQPSRPVFESRKYSKQHQANDLGVPAIVSVFAGRIADAGVDPLVHVATCRKVLREACPRAEMLWASPRQVYDVVLAAKAGCEVITLSPDLIAKLALCGKDLAEYSRETVFAFVADARAAGYEL